MKASPSPRHGMVSHEAAPFEIYRPNGDLGRLSLSEEMAEGEQKRSKHFDTNYYLHTAKVWRYGPNHGKKAAVPTIPEYVHFSFSVNWYLEVSCHLSMSVLNVELLRLVRGSREKLVCENIKISSAPARLEPTGSPLGLSGQTLTPSRNHIVAISIRTPLRAGLIDV